MKLQTGELSELIEKYKKEASNAAQERDDAKKAYDTHVSLDRYTEYSFPSDCGGAWQLQAWQGGKGEGAKDLRE